MSHVMHGLGFAALVARLMLAGVFIRAGLVKIVDLDEFKSAASGYRLLPGRLASPFARAVPTVEIVAGSALAAGVAVRVVAPLVALMLLTFATGMAVNLRRGRIISCGCNGRRSGLITWWRAVANVGLAALVPVVMTSAAGVAWSASIRGLTIPALLTLGMLWAGGHLAASGWRILAAGQP